MTIGPLAGTSRLDPLSFVVPIRVERACDAAPDGTWAEFEAMSIERDAAAVLWRLLEALRVVHAAGRRTAPVYPFVRAHRIREHPLVRARASEWSCGDGPPVAMDLSGWPAICVNQGEWADAVSRIEGALEPQGHVTLALDGVYFATNGDPVRGILMACAAWEVALRVFLADEGTWGVPNLYRRAVEKRGSEPFSEANQSWHFDVGAARRILAEQLPSWRNTILHGKELPIPWERAAEAAFVVADAITWLFGDPPRPELCVFPARASDWP